MHPVAAGEESIGGSFHRHVQRETVDRLAQALGCQPDDPVADEPATECWVLADVGTSDHGPVMAILDLSD